MKYRTSSEIPVRTRKHMSLLFDEAIRCLNDHTLDFPYDTVRSDVTYESIMERLEKYRHFLKQVETGQIPTSIPLMSIKEKTHFNTCERILSKAYETPSIERYSNFSLTSILTPVVKEKLSITPYRRVPIPLSEERIVNSDELNKSQETLRKGEKPISVCTKSFEQMIEESLVVHNGLTNKIKAIHKQSFLKRKSRAVRPIHEKSLTQCEDNTKETVRDVKKKLEFDKAVSKEEELGCGIELGKKKQEEIEKQKKDCKAFSKELQIELNAEKAKHNKEIKLIKQKEKVLTDRREIKVQSKLKITRSKNQSKEILQKLSSKNHMAISYKNPRKPNALNITKEKMLHKHAMKKNVKNYVKQYKAKNINSTIHKKVLDSNSKSVKYNKEVHNKINSSFITRRDNEEQRKVQITRSTTNTSTRKRKQHNATPMKPLTTTLKETEYDFIMLDKYHNNDSSKLISSTISNEGKITKVFSNGKIEQTLPNSVKRESFPDGYTIVYFNNKDIKQTYPDGKIMYYFAEARTTQTVFMSGLQVFKFPTGQIEKHHLDGTREIL